MLQMDDAPTFLAAVDDVVAPVIPLRVAPLDVLKDSIPVLKPARFYQGIVNTIDGYHEPIEHNGDYACAECWNEFPCGTHLAVHPECKEGNCVHRN